MLDHADQLFRRFDDHDAKVVIVGQGYVGLSVALRAAELGYTVVGYDSSPPRVEALRAGRSYVEDVSDEQLRTALAARYLPTVAPSDMSDFDVAIITVPTPLTDGVPDLSFIEAAGRDVLPGLRPGALVVLESTTYPGTTEELLRPILEAGGLRAGVDFFLGYSPERIDPGNREWTFVNTPKVVSGIDQLSCSVVERFYGSLVEKTVAVASTSEAELVKLLENTFRHVNIALVNELAMFARELGLDVWSALDATSTKPFGYMRFTPGPGVGGHCLPIDPSFLAWRVERQLGHRFRFVELANDVNGHMPSYVVTRIVNLLNQASRSVRGSRILLVGLAYKAGTSDGRESPSTPIGQQLVALGADVRVHDDHLPGDVPIGFEAPRVACTEEEVRAADLVVILVDHPDVPFDVICREANLVFDTKGCLRGREFTGEFL